MNYGSQPTHLQTNQFTQFFSVLSHFITDLSSDPFEEKMMILVIQKF